MINLYQGDCLELMKYIPDKSVDLILTDPPYNIGKAKWDKIPNYIEWCGKWFLECQRVLKNNGSFYWWHNDMVQIAQLMEWLRNNSEFVFNSFVVWDKGEFRALSWKNPSDESNLRSWFNTCEYCLLYTFQDSGELNAINRKGDLFSKIKEYMNNEKKKMMQLNGWDSIVQFNEYINFVTKTTSSASRHYFSNSQWRFPTEEMYKKLQSTGFFCRAYEDLLQEYENLRYTHNLDQNHNNVWRSNSQNNGKQHPTQKPNDLMERIIKTSSNQGDTVLDLFMGSGSTGVACLNTNRNFIGIELDDKYFEIAKNRIEDSSKKVSFFD